MPGNEEEALALVDAYRERTNTTQRLALPDGRASLPSPSALSCWPSGKSHMTRARTPSGAANVWLYMRGFLLALVCASAVIATATGSARYDPRISLPQHRVSVVVPDRWRVIYERVNGVVDPVTLFTASTFPLRVRPADQVGPSGVCSKTLQRAWRPEGVYVQLAEERDGASRKRMLRRVPTRPRHFTLTARGGAAAALYPGRQWRDRIPRGWAGVLRLLRHRPEGVTSDTRQGGGAPRQSPNRAAWLANSECRTSVPA